MPRHVPIFGLASLYILFRSRSGDLRSEVGVPTLKSGHTRTARRWLKVSDYSAHASASPGKLPRNEPTQESYPWSRGFLFTEHPPSFKGQCRWQGGQTVFRKCNRIQNSLRDIHGSLWPLPYHDINYYVKVFLGRVRSPAPGFKASVKFLVAVGRVTHHQSQPISENCVRVAGKWATASPPFGPGSRPRSSPQQVC